MRLLEGYHLTAQRRRAIKAVLDAGLTEGRVGRTDYRLTEVGPQTYRVAITARETDVFGRLSAVTDSVTVRV